MVRRMHPSSSVERNVSLVDGTTISINECSALAEHACTKSWYDIGMEGTVSLRLCISQSACITF